MDEKIYTHESYGMIDISRIRGGDRNLFGSDVQHDNKVAIRISTAELARGLNTDWFHGKDRLMEIELSPVQFAEAITNMNTSGVPCTIRYFNGQHKEECPYINKKDVFREEFARDINKVNQKTNELIGLITNLIDNKKNVTVADKKEILNTLYSIKQELSSNMPYVAECFDEQMERSISQGKAEIEAYIAYKVNTLGLKALKEENEKVLGIESE